MSDWPPAATPVPPASAEIGHLRTMAIASYVLMLLAIVNGLTAIAGVVLAYVKRADARGTIWRSHYDNVITAFWAMLIFAIVWLFSWPISLGLFWAHGFVWPWAPVLGIPVMIWLVAFPLAVIWYAYRLIRGLVHASDDKPY
jgi:uncharacterized membrane protein